MSDLPSVTTILKIHGKPGYEQECLHWMEETASIAGSFTGFLDKEIYRSVEAGNLFLNIFTFRSLNDLEAWERSEQRKWQTRKGENVFDGIVYKRQLSGLEFWFPPKESGQQPPLKWKMATVTIAVIFLLLNTLMPFLQRAFIVLGVPGLLKSLFGVLAIVGLMTYLIMPAITRLLSSWLSKR
ncbi:MAG: antibiotic biosynthesis monooxygenase [Bacteroidota bacterium]|nr:antibiotic biosynthesis monooxygenase [Bacteroidota bacterium]MDP4254680.1 antibiotic biosynthesis monooxygenase [Bacteroidota bacterium]MDP4260261.1 antibiotic biosynthesis monooxygenase [Bacteroidota bacterium]